MRIINLRVDNALFKKMQKDKEANDIPNWEMYIRFLFFGRKK